MCLSCRNERVSVNTTEVYLLVLVSSQVTAVFACVLRAVRWVDGEDLLELELELQRRRRRTSLSAPAATSAAAASATALALPLRAQHEMALSCNGAWTSSSAAPAESLSRPYRHHRRIWSCPVRAMGAPISEATAPFASNSNSDSSTNVTSSRAVKVLSAHVHSRPPAQCDTNTDTDALACTTPTHSYCNDESAGMPPAGTTDDTTGDDDDYEYDSEEREANAHPQRGSGSGRLEFARDTGRSSCGAADSYWNSSPSPSPAGAPAPAQAVAIARSLADVQSTRSSAHLPHRSDALFSASFLPAIYGVENAAAVFGEPASGRANTSADWRVAQPEPRAPVECDDPEAESMPPGFVAPSSSREVLVPISTRTRASVAHAEVSPAFQFSYASSLATSSNNVRQGSGLERQEQQSSESSTDSTCVSFATAASALCPGAEEMV